MLGWALLISCLPGERFQSLHGRCPTAEGSCVLCWHGSLGSPPALLSQELPNICVAVIL